MYPIYEMENTAVIFETTAMKPQRLRQRFAGSQWWDCWNQWSLCLSRLQDLSSNNSEQKTTGQRRYEVIIVTIVLTLWWTNIAMENGHL